MEAKYIFGIDLGTTYSVISYLDENWMIQTCSNESGDMITPSVVDLSGEEPVVGQIAKDNKVFSPHDVLDFFKCEMGQGEKIKYYGENYDKETTAIDLSAEVLKHLAVYASDCTGSRVAVVVITVPAYFSTVEKEATKKAAEKAGFEKVYLIEEPTAAAVYYGYKGDKNETVLVYDLGGGTFDIVAVDINGYHYDCFAVDGDQQLGGKNWDKIMQDEIIKKRLAEQGCDISCLNEEDEAAIQAAAEKAKKELTSKTAANIRLRLDEGKFNFDVTREEFEEKTKCLLDRTIEKTRFIKEKAEQEGKNITKILLVGGSSYMPQVQERLTAEFPDIEVPNPMDPNMAVSKGAAYYGVVILKKLEEEKNRLEKEGIKIEEISLVSEESGENSALKGFGLTSGEKEIMQNTNFVLSPSEDEVIEIAKVSVSSIGIKGRADGKDLIMTLLKRGGKLPVVTEIDIPLDDSAITMGKVEISLFEHRLEDLYVDPNNSDAGLKELQKKSGEISKGLPLKSKMHIHMEIDEEGLLRLVATDPAGMAIDLEAKAEAKSSD